MIAYANAHTIAIYYGEESWLGIIENCLIPYFEEMNQKEFSVIMYLNNLKGENIQLKYIGDSSCIKKHIKQAKKIFLKYINEHPSEKKLLCKDLYFQNVPNNSVHYMNIMIEEQGVSVNDKEQKLVLALIKSLPQTLINPLYKKEDLDNCIFEICLSLNFLLIKSLNLNKFFCESMYHSLFNHNYLASNHTNDHILSLQLEFEENLNYLNYLYLSDEYMHSEYYSMFRCFCTYLKHNTDNMEEEYRKNLLMLIVSEIDVFFNKRFNQYLFYFIYKYFYQFND
ncbi:hypothetical protein [Spirosoma lituiforme]